jgi:hypothetical protein
MKQYIIEEDELEQLAEMASADKCPKTLEFLLDVIRKREFNPAAELARRTKGLRTEAKTAAARDNGKLGGRPPKNPSLPRPRAYGVWCELHLPKLAGSEGRKLSQSDLICEASGCRVRAVYSF